ncbi:hypothetical protein LUZ60_011289 [Juncus effusus]|nr:hypothetical protein LUZ60_011289 [Juncus effusus]
MATVSQAQFHVLAVDDSLLDRKLIERLLKTSSYQVTTVDSGSKALEFLGLSNKQEIGVNLIITDYCMPEMSGYDLLRKIKESSFLKDIPVVVISSENVPSRINQCLEEGAEAFFLKPLKLSDLTKLEPQIMKSKDCCENRSHPEKKKRIITRGNKRKRIEGGKYSEKNKQTKKNKTTFY